MYNRQTNRLQSWQFGVMMDWWCRLTSNSSKSARNASWKQAQLTDAWNWCALRDFRCSILRQNHVQTTFEIRSSINPTSTFLHEIYHNLWLWSHKKSKHFRVFLIFTWFAVEFLSLDFTFIAAVCVYAGWLSLHVFSELLNAINIQHNLSKLI